MTIIIILSGDTFIKSAYSTPQIHFFGADVYSYYTQLLKTGGTKDFKLPPVDFSDKTRCVLNSSKMGQANAARDKLYDLRQCNLSGQDASGFDLSGVIMTKTDLSNANFKEAQFSKAYLHGRFLMD